jgi:UDP-N-acetyl-D-glucosamine/UDP-N-acetyl-D-galactosamine dehydrogenase
MGIYVASQVVRLLVRQGTVIPQAKILVMGVTFKENCPDVRNTRVVDVVQELASFGAEVEIYDPWADPAVVEHEYGLKIMTEAPVAGRYDGIVMAVAHQQFRELPAGSIRAFGKQPHIVYDIKGVLPAAEVDARL